MGMAPARLRKGHVGDDEEDDVVVLDGSSEMEEELKHDHDYDGVMEVEEEEEDDLEMLPEQGSTDPDRESSTNHLRMVLN